MRENLHIYVDFEATQWSNEIIAIGASCTFGEIDCLVRPRKLGKVTPFITRLTGITKEMLQFAEPIEKAFETFYFWVTEMQRYAMIEAGSDVSIIYHCFGTSDKDFLNASMRKLSAHSIIKPFFCSMIKNLQDDSPRVSQYFCCSSSIGLYKALKFFCPTLNKQTHDPLDDAIALQQLMQYIAQADPVTSCPWAEYISSASEQKCKTHEKKKYIITVTPCANNPATATRKFSTCGDAIEWFYQKTIKKISQNKETYH